MGIKLMPELMPEDKKVYIKDMDSEIDAWLDDNIEDGNYYIAENKICIKHVFMPTPGNQNEYRIDGYYLLFEHAEDAMAFKLWWI